MEYAVAALLMWPYPYVRLLITVSPLHTYGCLFPMLRPNGLYRMVKKKILSCP